MIPALGEEGAAALHRRLTELTLAQVRASGLDHEVRTTGAPAEAFRQWLGNVGMAEQGAGDLGERLHRAAAPYPVIFIGADAPDLRADHLRSAAAALNAHAAVIGPATDGGYWLLGLAQAVAALFDAVDWGTDQVFAQTLRRLRASGIEPALLPVLHDLDRPEDLARWPDLAW